MTRRRRTTLLAGAFLIGLAIVAVVGGVAKPAGGAPASATGTGRIGDAQRDVADMQPEVANGIDDADRAARTGLAELQLARETADPAHYERAEAAFERALALERDHVEAIIGLGTLALARHDFAAALDFGERAAELDPSGARALGVTGDALVELGRYDEALETVQRMVDIRPDLASYSRVSYLRELHGDLPGAIDAMELAVEAGGPSVENTEYVRVQLGHLHLASGDLAAAESAFRAALDRLPDYVHATAGLARVRSAQGRLPDAIALLESASARMPLPEFVIALGEAYEAAGRDAEAADQYGLAEVMQSLLDANGVEVDLELAAFISDHGDPERAVELARDAYERAPSLRAADVLAWSLFAAGETDEASDYADEALRTGWRDARVLVHAGLIAEAAGLENVARERLELALELSPGFSPLYAPIAADALARLGGR